MVLCYGVIEKKKANEVCKEILIEISHLHERMIEGNIVSDSEYYEEVVIVPRTKLGHSDSTRSFTLMQIQLLFRAAFVMTINKSHSIVEAQIGL
ncbi:Hypothetical predicted protein [Octopus vulgaris]|uniref:Uncharacterized protein n=1 Tax=Octopus vulgaris TaxID=6645 RepID=A0AA36BD35_OCTVU|nr:Hypothetical predicted protein [Octopus vulgaris]